MGREELAGTKMTHTLKHDTPEFSMKIEYDGDTEDIMISQLHVDLHRALDALDSAVSLATFEVKRKVSPVTDYDYSFTSQDGRAWNQVLRIVNPADPSMTFDVPDFWKLSEFILHRSVRDSVTQLIVKFGVSKITVTWF